MGEVNSCRSYPSSATATAPLILAQLLGPKLGIKWKRAVFLEVSVNGRGCWAVNNNLVPNHEKNSQIMAKQVVGSSRASQLRGGVKDFLESQHH